MTERQAILDYMSWDQSKGYNLTMGGGGSGGYRHSDSHKEKMRDRLKGVPRPQSVKDKLKESHKRFCKPVYVDGKKFDSIGEAADFLGCDRHNIHPAIRKGSKIYGHTVSWEVN